MEKAYEKGPISCKLYIKAGEIEATYDFRAKLTPLHVDYDEHRGGNPDAAISGIIDEVSKRLKETFKK